MSKSSHVMDEDWAVLSSFFPDDWEVLGKDTNALKGLRKDKTAESLMRTLLIHVGCGYSLRETAVRARRANLRETIGDWKTIAAELSEPPRRRKTQSNRFKTS